MYKLFDNYPEQTSLLNVLEITMENIKTFLCDIAPVKPIEPVSDINTAVPSGSGIPKYISDTTPLIFYSDVVDNTNPDFIVSDEARFSISQLRYLDFPVYCIFYSWMPAPILIFVTNNYHYSASSGLIEGIQKYNGAWDDFNKRPHICVAFDLYAFNVDNKGLPFYEDYTYGERFYYMAGGGVAEDRLPVGDRTYDKSTCNVCPMLILDPFYNSIAPIPCDRSAATTIIKDFQFAMSLHNNVISFYGIFNATKQASSVITSFITPLSTQSVHGITLSSPDKAILCKSDAIAYLSVYASGRNHNMQSNNRSFFVNVFGRAGRIPANPRIFILGANADYNIAKGERNLYSFEYDVNWNSYKNVSAYNNQFKRPLVKSGMKYLNDTNPDKFDGDFTLSYGWKVPTITTTFHNILLRPVNADIYYSRIDLPRFPVLMNDFLSDYSSNHASLVGSSLSGDTTVFSVMFPTQSSNTLNDHFVAYPLNVYIKREPIDTNTYSLYCTLNFIFYSHRMYDNDDRFHEYTYVNKRFVGVSNRISGVLYLVDENRELVV